LAGPLAVVEPLKLATVFIAGEGHWSMSGLVMPVGYASVCLSAIGCSLSLNRNCSLPWFARAWARFVAARARVWRSVASRASTLA
jgi:hypothetical protein